MGEGSNSEEKAEIKHAPLYGGTVIESETQGVTKSKYSPQELYNLRKWYGKWALRYSFVHFCLVAALFLGPIGFEFYSIVFLILNAFGSHLHLWPAMRATLVTNGETWRINALFFFILFIYSLTIVIIAFPDSLDQKGFVKLGFILFLGPFLFMFTAYMELAKGENQ